ncbi:MAG: hypothetical protein ACOYBP_04125 [Microbacteriaceae bacterium]
MADDDYVYSQHERVVKRAEEGPVTVKAVAKASVGSRLGRFNEAVGLRITQSVGTMWAAYAFAALTLVSLPAALMSGSAIIIVSWVAQTFLQLVLLPIIIVGQNIQARAADARAAATYEDAGAILEESKQIQMHLEAQDRAISHILVQVKQLRDEARSG